MSNNTSFSKISNQSKQSNKTGSDIRSQDEQFVTNCLASGRNLYSTRKGIIGLDIPIKFEHIDPYYPICGVTLWRAITKTPSPVDYDKLPYGEVRNDALRNNIIVDITKAAAFMRSIKSFAVVNAQHMRESDEPLPVPKHLKPYIKQMSKTESEALREMTIDYVPSQLRLGINSSSIEILASLSGLTVMTIS